MISKCMLYRIPEPGPGVEVARRTSLLPARDHQQDLAYKGRGQIRPLICPLLPALICNIFTLKCLKCFSEKTNECIFCVIVQVCDISAKYFFI